MPYKDPKSEAARKSHREAVKRWNRNNPEKARSIWRKSYHKNKHKHRDRVNQYSKEWKQRNRLKCLIHYGGNPPKCACCGEDHIEFLTIDHIEGGGNKHRKKVTGGHNCFFRWLIKNNFPAGYRVLCYNCNCAIGHYGYCPHKK